MDDFFNNDLDEETIESIVNCCNDLLNHKWGKIKSDSLDIKKCAGGMANRVFHVKPKEPNSYTLKEVIIRLHGSKLLNNIGKPKFLGDAVEGIIFYLIGEKSIGAKLLALSIKERIEEYIPNTNVPKRIIFSRNIDFIFASKIVDVHILDMPLVRRPLFLNLTFGNELVNLSDLREQKRSEIGKQDNSNVLNDFNARKEITWLFHHMSAINSRLVFSHNDIHTYNMLFRNDKGTLEEDKIRIDQVQFIDFELATYNYRAYDIAYFLGFRYHHSIEKNDVDKIRLATEDDKRYVAKEYLKNWAKKSEIFDPEIDNIDHLIMEIDFFMLFAHIFCFGFAIRESFQNINREYVEFRYSCYKKDKKEFIRKYSDMISEPKLSLEELMQLY